MRSEQLRTGRNVGRARARALMVEVTVTIIVMVTDTCHINDTIRYGTIRYDINSDAGKILKRELRDKAHLPS